MNLLCLCQNVDVYISQMVIKVFIFRTPVYLFTLNQMHSMTGQYRVKVAEFGKLNKMNNNCFAKPHKISSKFRPRILLINKSVQI